MWGLFVEEFDKRHHFQGEPHIRLGGPGPQNDERQGGGRSRLASSSHTSVQEVGIEVVVIHPDFWADKTKHGNAYDIALVKTDKVGRRRVVSIVKVIE